MKKGGMDPLSKRFGPLGFIEDRSHIGQDLALGPAAAMFGMLGCTQVLAAWSVQRSRISSSALHIASMSRVGPETIPNPGPCLRVTALWGRTSILGDQVDDNLGKFRVCSERAEFWG